jgi:PEP-CTERM motif
MKINLRKATASVLTAAGMLWGVTDAYALDHTVGDPSFEQIGLGAGEYYFFQGPPNSPFWKDHRNSTGKNRAYNTTWATVTSPNTPDPHTGNQAVDGEGAYNWQVLPDTFVADRKYTYTAWVQGYGGNTNDALDRAWLYLFAGAGPNGDIAPGDYLVGNAGTTAPGNMDGSSLIRAAWHSTGTIDGIFGTGAGAHSFLPFSGFNRDAGSAWTQIGVSYTATAADAGKRIGLGFWANALGAVDDVGLSSVPEPTSLILVGAGLAGGGLLVRRRRD